MWDRCNDKTHRNKNVQQFVIMENKKIIGGKETTLALSPVFVG